jgi:hypothetical protein
MLRIYDMTRISVALIIMLVLFVASAHALDDSETAKIQYLITSVETLEGAKFIRNGREYDAGTASGHLRLKLKTAGGKVRTAEDFIDLCASRSSMTGQPYLIRFTDGSTVKSETFFRDKLRAFSADKS